MSLNIDHFRTLYPFKSHWLDRGGLRYHYLDEGAGEPLLCVHGNPTWSFMYRELIRVWAPASRPAPRTSWRRTRSTCSKTA